ncbi:MAG: replicative DNA helicase [Longimicrobiales bacterium]|jgi:replicative DNA helicase|nr:replicative DNA helicase [Longimicrobiales bacterium]
MPASLEAETAVLGGMMIDREAVIRAIEKVNSAAFYREGNRRIFAAMSRLFERGDVIDPITVSEELKKTGELEASGGLDYLATLVDAVPTAANIEYHANIVREKALLRRLVDRASSIIRDVYDQGERDVEQLLDIAEAKIFEVADSHKREGFVWIKDILWKTFEKIEERQTAGSGITGVATGFTDLDRMTTGLQKGDLCIIAARPSMGKTAFALNVASSAAINHQAAVGIFSLEMSSEQLVQRILCSEGRVDAQNLRRGRLSPEENSRLAKAAGHLNTAPIWIDDQPGSNVLEVRAKARRMQSDLRADGQELGMIVIDYMQLMSGTGKSESRVQEVSQISRGLKALARELDVPLVALSQLSRGPEQRTDKRPMLSDLRESGSIEQDADIVMFLFRPEYYASAENRHEMEGKAELIISKQRNGPTGVVPLFFHKAYTRFDSVVGEMATGGGGDGYGGGNGNGFGP